MTFDPSTRTLKAERNSPSQLFLDDMVRAIETMYLSSLAPNASDSLKRDVRVIYSWLGQEPGPLTPISVAMVKLGIVGYISAVGQTVPMLAQLIPMLEPLRNNFPHFEPPLELPPPVAVMDAFDRLFADEKTAEKRRQDEFFLKRHLQRISSKLSKETPDRRLLARVRQLSDFSKVFLVVTAVWIMWVWIRTATAFELLGYYFGRWDGDMFLPNVLVVPVLLLGGRYIRSLCVRRRL